MKKKLANLLRRWASKLSPEHTAPDLQLAGAHTFRAAKHYTRYELRAIEHEPDLVALIDMDNRRRLLNDIALAMYQAGAITFHTEPELCPDSHDVLIATCRAVVVKR